MTVCLVASLDTVDKETGMQWTLVVVEWLVVIADARARFYRNVDKMTSFGETEEETVETTDTAQGWL